MHIIVFKLLFLIIPWFPACIADDNAEIELFDENEPRSRLLMINGNMYFHAGKGKNISFVTNNGGSIWLAQTDISHLPSLAAFDDLREGVNDMKADAEVLRSRVNGVNGLLLSFVNITRNVMAATRNISIDVKAIKEWRKDRNTKDVKLRKYLTRIAKGIKSLVETLKFNGCEEKPCQGGATCIPQMGKKVFCLCPPHRTGDTCEEDVDECALYEHDQGCQNNGTCENIDNGFLCHCPTGFHGPLCQFKQSSCRRNPGMCGHGHCIESSEGDVSDYKCICELGYKISSDPENPTCIDINECLTSPCHPGVDCINLPGSFQCSGCPKGFHGNGQNCADIDECSQPNYPCSTSPRAQCFNTVGSYHCGPCPAGYRGDGRLCKRFSACAGRPCHPQATCQDDIDNINAGGFVCHCPDGFLGDGIGPAGCRKGNATVCKLGGRCLNGATCKAVTEDSYLCLCPEGYFGSRCEKVSECISAPCKNGATCQYDVTNGYTCICPPGFYGHDCELEEDSCGQHFTSREGNVTFPESFDLSAGKMCDLVIVPQLANNEALRITFTLFTDMEATVGGPTDCATTLGNLTLFDGDNDNSNIFAIFCGSAASPKAPIVGSPITMTGSRAMLRFQGTKGRFAISWELKKRECGYRTSVPDGSLVIPTHYQNFSCEWFLSANMNQVVEITIPPVKLGTEERNCSVNQLEIYDGYTAYAAHRVIHFCSSVNETVTVRSTGPFMSVMFTNDLLYGSNSQLPGFQMSYKFVTPDHSCGGSFKNPDGSWDFSGEITTPNWGGFYPPDSHCTWLIDGSGAPDDSNSTTAITAMHSLKLEIPDFDVPSPFIFSLDRSMISLWHSRMTIRGRRPLFRSLIKCTQDSLNIFSDGNLIFDGCNPHRPPSSMLIPEGKAIVQFKSDSKNQGKGFKMKYSLVCEKRLTGNGTIQTWNYPDGGIKGKCTYIISADSTHAIILKVKTIGLRVFNTNTCFYSKTISDDIEDYVKISGGREDDKVLNNKYICAKFPFVEEGEFVLSASRPLTIEYSSSGHPENKGILLEYSTIDVGCGGFFSQSNGVVNSPNYPNKYLPHMHCIYHINVPWSKQVRLTFDNFDLEVVQNDDCNYDRVEIYDKYISESNHGKLLGKFCGSMSPPSILSPTYSMSLVFISDRSIAGNGFSARFESVDETIDCDRTFTAPTGNIIFDSSKGRFGECVYHIALPTNNKVLLNVMNMSLPCTKGSLQVRNGVSAQAPGFGQLWRESEICNEHPVDFTIRSHGSRMYLKLTLLDPTNVTFNISYESITQNCGGRVTGVSGTLATPQYPEKDSRSMNCEWNVAVAPGNKVSFQLAMVDDLRSSDDNGFCGIFASNRIDVHDGPEVGAPLLRRFCRKTYGAEAVVSDDHEMLVKYRQQGGVNTGALFGFLAHYTTVCRDIVFTDLTGTIQSPGFPDNVYTNRFCSWTIKVPPGNRIKLYFVEFVIDQTVPYYRRTCENYIKFGEGEVAQALIMVDGKTNVTNNLVDTCANVRPVEIRSANNSITMTFQSKKKEENKFWMTWTTIGCGGHMMNPANISVKQDDLDRNSDVYECHWKVTAPVGKKIQLRINELLIFRPDATATCDYNNEKYSGIQTFAGLNNASGVPQDKMCAATKDGSIVFQSHSNEMFIMMKVQRKHVATNENFFSGRVIFIDTNESEQDDCSAVIEVPLNGNRTIHSPRFPREYPRDAHCKWIFKAPHGHHLKYVLKEYKTPNSHPQNNVFKGWNNMGTGNLTCKHPMQLIEGSLAIFEGNTTRTRIVDRVCQDITEPLIYDVPTQESLVFFNGASSPRSYQSGESEKDKRIGFVLEAVSECGGLQFATSEEQSLQFFDMPISICNITIRKKDPSDSGVYIRLDEYFLKNQVSQYHRRTTEYGTDVIEISVDGGEPQVRPLFMSMMMGTFPSTHEEFRGTDEIKITIAKRSSLLAPQINIAYSTDIESCGASLGARQGLVKTSKLKEDSECIWTVENSPGNRVHIIIGGLYLPPSENCAESYVEVREFNESGTVLGRFCGAERPEFKAQTLWIKLRYVKPNQDDSEMDDIINEEEGNEVVEPFLRFRYSHVNGGILNTPGAIEHPLSPAGSTVEYKLIGEPEKGILIKFDELNFPIYIPAETVYMPSGLYFMEADTKFFAVIGKMRDMLQSGSKLAITGFTPPKEIYLPFNNAILYAVGMHDKNVAFKLRWSVVPLRSAEELNGTAIEDKKYNCGSHLAPTWAWQTLKSPVRQIGDAESGYDNDLHCMWSMTRPMMRGIQIQVIKMDLEDMTGCPYDYFAIIADDDNDDSTDDQLLEKAHKLCRRETENITFSYNYNRKLNLHFVSDRSRGGSGFEIRYRYSCNSFDFIRKDFGYFAHQLTSPGWPTEALATDCSWALVLESNRRISVTINNLTLPIAPCKDSYISVHARSIGALVSSVAPESRICGTLDESNTRNFTIPHGRLYIRYFDKKLENPTGFKLFIEEIIEECSVTFYVDENTPNRTFYSPLWPQLIPNSLDCDYVIRAPAGHRLQFTVDPIGFRMESSDNDTCFCDSCDYLEIRDGATESSPLIGRYCDIRPPSTITSTGSFLYVKIKTDSYANSAAFKAVYKMAECGGTVILNPNKPTLLQSPHFPNAYPMQAECEWAVYSPNSHFINMTVNHLWISWTPNCTTERLMITDGNATGPYIMEPACNPGRMEKLDYRSSSSRATVSFVANSTVQRAGRGFCKDKKCGFEVELRVSDQGCGGIINNNQGTITAPGYPNKLLPNVKCRWDLQAGIGYRYLLEFEFIDTTRHGFYQQRFDSNTFTKSRACFMDLHFFNGRFQENNPNMLNHRYFCEKELTYLTEADIATIMYSDTTTRDTMAINPNAVGDSFYVPFRLNYTRVPAHIDTKGCSYKITSNTTINMDTYAKVNASNEAHYCHVVINRPPEYATTVIRILDYTDQQAAYSRECTSWGSYIEIMSEEDDDVRDVYERLCNATFMGITREVRREYLNVDLHIHVSTILSLFTTEGGQAFNLSIEFYECGGIINGEPNSGFLESPNYGNGHYFPNQDCVWQLRAPEGQVVWINITDIDIEQHVQCDHDVLIIGEGKDNSIIHRYCNPDNQFDNVSDQLSLQERHRTFRTYSRYLTFTWHTDFSNEGRGFKIEYEFVDVGDGCGFTTHAMTGVVHSPQFPKDYTNDEECIWDIQVPVGYHINLKYTHFDIEASENCVNDFLQISEEHSARANDPLGDYYFLFQDEEKKEPQCGIVTPKMFESTANRIRLNFTSNSRVNAKGFRAEWNAVCGAVYQLSHYSIVSPLYPSHYPNEDMACSYIIEPTEEHAKSVVVLKVLDLDLSPVKIEFGRYPCESDYVEVVDVMAERVVKVYCGGEPYVAEPIAIRGAVAIRMVSNKTFMHGPMKLHRGFQFSYAMQKCGGDIFMMEENEFMTPISSPAYPLDYPHDLDCVWNITTTGDRVFAIKFLTMDIEQTYGCDMDWVEMFDGPEITNKSKMGQYCGTNKDMPQQVMRTQGNQMIIRFVSDRSMSQGGFKLILTATLGPKHGCGGKLESKAEWSTLSPPMNGDSYYHNLHCGWTISGPEKTMIEFKLNSMDTEKLQPLPGGSPKGLTCVDQLMIYDGYKAFSPELVRDLCSETVPTLPAFYHASHRVAHVLFETDGSGGGKGFELQYRSIAPDCGDWFTARDAVQTVAYEAKPKSGAPPGQTIQRCQWVIQTDSQTPMELHLKQLKFSTPDGDCSDAFVEIRDVGSIAKCQHPACAGHESDKKVIKYCGDVPTAAPFISNTMAVQITTSAIITKDKHASFSLDYQLLPACNRTIDASEVKSGRLTSPNYPNPYNHNTSCTTTIKAAPNHFVMLAFRQFRVEMGRPTFFAINSTRRYSPSRYTYRIVSCDHDFVQVYEKEKVNKTKQYCGAGLPRTFLSSGNELSVFFETDYSVAGEGYDASFYTTKYSSVTQTYNFAPIHDPIGALTSVGYPNGYNASTTQKWTVIPPSGQVCEFEIVSLSMAVQKPGVDCASMEEYLMIENKGRAEKEVISQRLRGCSHVAPQTFTLMPGAGREISFTFKSDAVANNDGIGIRIVWSCHVSNVPPY